MAEPDGTVVDNNYDKPEEEDEEEEEEEEGDEVAPRWGTWEELLLAFAVNRHGTSRWDSVASELRKRSSDAGLILTPQNCRQRYLDLKRRFMLQNDAVHNKLLNDDKSDAAGGGGGGGKETVPLLEELRKLRVAELRREVQRYDLNIESLELQMKRMEEDREGSLRSEKNSEEISDLEKKDEEEKNDAQVEPEEKAWPGSLAGEVAAGEESEKDHMSVNESNSTDLDGEKPRTGEKESEPDTAGKVQEELDRTGDAREGPVGLKAESDRTGNAKPVREESCNGSSDSIEKDPVRVVKVERASDSVDLVESEAESKDVGEEAAKESSDVQSSASRSRKEEENDKMRRGRTSGDERDHEDQSRTDKESFAASQPLIDFLQNLRSHKSGSVFERRLQSQENSKYRNLIRQHVDLESMETRLKEGWYLGSSSKFFRDLLLLVNNALVFFNNNSSEFHAATELRKLISKEMSQKYSKSDSSSGKQISLQSLSLPKKEDPEPSHSLLLKPRIAGSMIVCRKRSSIAAKSSASSDKRKEQTVPLLAEEKDTKPHPCQSSGNTEEPKITKKRTRDRFPSASASTKKNNKNPGNSNSNITNKNLAVELGKNQGKGGGSSSSHQPEPKSENKKNQSTSDSKKRGAASFLNRMKQSPPSNNGALLDALKNTPLTSDGNNTRGGSEQKKKKEQVTRRSSEPRQRREKGSPVKRSVGRPPKREAVPPPPSLGKRGRDRGEAQTSKQPKKRSRKL